jgi:archaeosortase A (PGF-CTERM-specific)
MAAAFGTVPWVAMDAFAWLLVAAFGASGLLGTGNPVLARRIGGVTWGAFGVFWLLLAPHFLLTKHSVIEGLLAVLALPVCLYAGLQLYNGRDSLFLFSRAIAAMGLIYLPFLSMPLLKGALIEIVTSQVEVVLTSLGHPPQVITDDQGFRSTFYYEHGGQAYTMQVLLACTGLGSMAIFGGLIAALKAPLDRKLAAVAIVVPVVWVLNLGRVTFITLAHGRQWFRGVLEGPIMTLFATSDPNKVSFILADKVLAQSLSVLALVAITLALVRVVPELVVVIEELVAIVLDEDLDLAETFDVSVPESGP